MAWDQATPGTIPTTQATDAEVTAMREALYRDESRYVPERCKRIRILGERGCELIRPADFLDFLPHILYRGVG